MKVKHKLVKLLFLSISVFLFSCEEDEGVQFINEVEFLEENINGQWELTSFDISGEKEVNLLDETEQVVGTASLDFSAASTTNNFIISLNSTGGVVKEETFSTGTVTFFNNKSIASVNPLLLVGDELATKSSSETYGGIFFDSTYDVTWKYANKKITFTGTKTEGDETITVTKVATVTFSNDGTLRVSIPLTETLFFGQDALVGEITVSETEQGVVGTETRPSGNASFIFTLLEKEDKVIETPAVTE